jgi:hypothetical protein
VIEGETEVTRRRKNLLCHGTRLTAEKCQDTTKLAEKFKIICVSAMQKSAE